MDNKPTTILLVEDSPDDAFLLKEMLLEIPAFRFYLIHVERLSEGIDQVKDSDFDVVLLDLSLSDSSGMDTFTRMQQVAPNIPIIMITGMDNEELALEMVNAGAQDYLIKGESDGKLLVKSIRYAIERKRTQDQIVHAKEEWEQTFDAVPDLIAIIDPQHRILRANKAMAAQIGCSPDQCVGITCYEAVHNLDSPPDYCPHSKLLLDGNEHNTEIFEKRLGGNFYITASPILDKDGKLRASVHVAHNITVRKQMEDELRYSEERFRVLYNKSPDMFVSVSPDDGSILQCNNTVLNKTGYLKEEIVGTPIFKMYHDDCMDSVKEAFQQFIKTGEVRDKELILQIKDGSKIPVSLNAKAVRDVTGKILHSISSWRDITERKQAEAEKKKLEVHLRQQQKLESIGTLAGGIAHEINNPINGILNYAQLIIDKLEEDGSIKRFASEIVHETERVTVIVKNLLTFARHEKEAHSPALVSDIINNTLSLLQTIIRHDNITLEVDVPDDLPMIKCRSQQIQQVVMNLLTNARDALNEKYPKYDESKIMIVKARSLEKDTQKWIRLTVEDHGNGIPEEIKERIFDPFFTTKDKSKGTGLGLSISHGIIEDHLGEMHVESKPGEYTRFHVDLRVDNGWSLDNSHGKETEDENE